MSYYVEIHCDKLLEEGPRSRGILVSICYSHSNDNAQASFSNNIGGGDLKRRIAEEARAQGWKRVGTSKKWVCPGCQFAMAKA